MIFEDKNNFLLLWTIFQVFLTFIVLVASFTGPTSASVFKVIIALFF